MKISAHILTLCLILFCSCDRQSILNDIVSDSTVRLAINGYNVFTYDALTCQMGFCRGKREFRVHTDTMSDYFVITLDKIPVSEGEGVTADITWTSPQDVGIKKNVALETAKVEGDKIWLWNYQARITAVVRILE